MIITFPALIAAIVGLLMFVLAKHAKVEKIGEHLMWTGMLVLLMSTMGHTMRLF